MTLKEWIYKWKGRARQAISYVIQHKHLWIVISLAISCFIKHCRGSQLPLATPCFIGLWGLRLVADVPAQAANSLLTLPISFFFFLLQNTLKRNLTTYFTNCVWAKKPISAYPDDPRHFKRIKPCIQLYSALFMHVFAQLVEYGRRKNGHQPEARLCGRDVTLAITTAH